jgi:2-keto-3-deoxy-L-rhamnonate aldolase RhmA
MQNPFKNMLSNKELSTGYPVGSWVMSASPVVAEAMGCAGFDWAVVDMEHTPLDMMEVIHLLQAIAGTPMLPITRVPWNDTVLVKRVLDAGAQTLMAAMSRGSRFGTVKDYFKVANAAVSVIVQIETPEAMSRMKEIASVEGVDSVFIGPGDLSGAMGHVGNLMHPDVVALMAEGVKACHAAGKPIGTVGGTAEAVATYRTAGFDYIGVASDLGLMMRNCAAVLSTIKAQDIKIHSQGY